MNRTPAEVAAVVEARMAAYVAATADVASRALELAEAPRYSPARHAYDLARLAQADARARLEVMAEILSDFGPGYTLVAVQMLEAATRNAELSSIMANLDAGRECLKGVA